MRCSGAAPTSTPNTTTAYWLVKADEMIPEFGSQTPPTRSDNWTGLSAAESGADKRGPAPYYAAQTNLTAAANDSWPDADTLASSIDNSYVHIEGILITRVMIAIAAFGVVGNLLTLLVLTRRRWQHSHRRAKLTDNRAAESDIIGLISLSVSDLLCCVAILPHVAADLEKFAYKSVTFQLVYSVYKNAILNTFVMSSTWFTVAMTINRYVNLCHPIVALRFSRPQVMKGVIVTLVVFCVVFNMPRFFLLEIESICVNEMYMYYPYVGPLKRAPLLQTIYQWSFFAVGICVPLVLLAFCNCRIIHTVRLSFGVEQRQSIERNIITRTLVTIVIFYLILVSPAEIVNFFKENVVTENLPVYNLAVTIANTFQALNFACNFIPYLVLDKHFRRTIRDIMNCPGQKTVILRFESVTSSSNGRPAFPYFSNPTSTSARTGSYVMSGGKKTRVKLISEPIALNETNVMPSNIDLMIK